MTSNTPLRESAHLGFKEIWKDDWLKWICGFANAQGGTLCIGIDDRGNPVGLADSKKLLEDIPNKVRDALGFFVQVNLRQDAGGRQHLEIVVEPQPYPISYHGQYFLRSGTTNQQLKGSALDGFILRKQGRSWDSVPVVGLKVADLDGKAFELFESWAAASDRIPKADLSKPRSVLLKKLRLLDDHYLNRAGALLFARDPENFVAGASIKIGFFQEHSKLLFQDEVRGNCLVQLQTCMDLLTTKYLKSLISFKDIIRAETLPVPREALREALLNAIINKDYAVASPIQIRVFADRLEIVNYGGLPERWTIDTLLEPHSSIPYNPNIANTFFRAGLIKSWGRGIDRIVTVCREKGVCTPEFLDKAHCIWTIFHFNTFVQIQVVGVKSPEPKTDIEKKPSVQVGLATKVKSSKLSAKQLDIFNHIRINGPLTSSMVAKQFGDLTPAAARYHLGILRDCGLIEKSGNGRWSRWSAKTDPDRC